MCNVHGGRAPQVLDAARRRLLEMVAPALAQLRKLLEEADGDSVKLGAIREVLDRSGLKVADLLAIDNRVEIVVRYSDAPMPIPALASRNGFEED